MKPFLFPPVLTFSLSSSLVFNPCGGKKVPTLRIQLSSRFFSLLHKLQVHPGPGLCSAAFNISSFTSIASKRVISK